jgi:hypothetical protein
MYIMEMKAPEAECEHVLVATTPMRRSPAGQGGPAL